MRQILRILAVLGVLVVLNALFVFVLLWAYLVMLPTVVGGGLTYLRHGEAPVDLLQLPVPWELYAVLVAGFLIAQLYYGYRRVLAGTRGVDSAEEHAIARTVRRLAIATDVPAPAVRVVDDETPSCYTVGRVTDATVVVTTGLVARLDAEEVEAVLAHEIAHIANRDVTLMTVTTLFLEIASRVYDEARLLRRAVTNPEELPDHRKVLLRFFVPLAALTYVFVAPLLWLFPTVARWATRTLSHSREFAADAAAGHITGKPLALATALVTLAEADQTPATDLRTARTRALCVFPTSLVAGSDTADLPVIGRPPGRDRRRDQVSAWLDGTTPAQTTHATHPPVAARIRRLQAVAAQLEESL